MDDDANNPNPEPDLEINYNSEASTGGDNNKRKRESKLRSKVWQDFTKIIKEDGKCDKCQCNHCQKLFTCSSRSGTTHLLRHITEGICPVFKKDNGARPIPIASYSPNSNVLLPWKFDHHHHSGSGQSSAQQLRADVEDPVGPRPFKTIVGEDEYGQTPPLTFRGKLPSKSQTKGGDAWMNEFRHSVAKLVELTNRKIPTGLGPGPTDYSVSAALKCLNDMKDIPQSSEMYLDAFEILQDGGERECFICLPSEPRRRWLQRVLHRRHPMRYSSNM